MSNGDELDVVVVGAGPAGLACAHELASGGMATAVCERGDLAGAKNLSGGRLYLDPIREMCRELLEGAPFERQVASESIVLTHGKASTSFRLDHEVDSEKPHSVIVLRAKFDQFLADKATEKEAFVMGEQRVDGLLREDDKVVGVKVGGEDLRARVVVAADGALSFLAEDAQLRKDRNKDHFALGAKELIKLDSSVINERFNVETGHGAARMYLGDVTRGMQGGGFLYTNNDSISLGLVVQVSALSEREKSDESMSDLVEEFKNRPDVAKLIEGGETVEYGAHLIPEGGYDALPALGIPGLLLVGDAAGLVINTGNILRGMDLAMASGVIAARSILKFKDANPGSGECLEHYKGAIDKSFIMKEMRTHRKAPDILSNDRIYGTYPKEVVELMKSVFVIGEDGKSVPVGSAVKTMRKNVGTWRAFRDMLRLLKL